VRVPGRLLVLRPPIRAALLALLLVPAGVSAQSLMVASPIVTIDDRTRTGTVVLINDGITPMEASISTFYGYPVTDSLGRMYLRTFPEVADTMPCAASWVQSFPRRLHIEPKSRATVRLLVTPPANLASGEYWARLVVATKGGQISVGGLPDSSGIEAKLDIEVRSVVGLFYRVGAVKTGVALANLRGAEQGDSLVGRVALTRQGNAAFVGSLKAQLRDAQGSVRAEQQLPLGVYYTLDPRFALPVAGLPPGRYELAVEALSSRPDLPSNLLLSTVPVRASVEVPLE
jgi:hypothetical protein